MDAESAFIRNPHSEVRAAHGNLTATKRRPRSRLKVRRLSRCQVFEAARILVWGRVVLPIQRHLERDACGVGVIFSERASYFMRFIESTHGHT